jgi:hypothetical protein
MPNVFAGVDVGQNGDSVDNVFMVGIMMLIAI